MSSKDILEVFGKNRFLIDRIRVQRLVTGDFYDWFFLRQKSSLKIVEKPKVFYFLNGVHFTCWRICSKDILEVFGKNRFLIDRIRVQRLVTGDFYDWFFLRQKSSLKIVEKPKVFYFLNGVHFTCWRILAVGSVRR